MSAAGWVSPEVWDASVDSGPLDPDLPWTTAADGSTVCAAQRDRAGHLHVRTLALTEADGPTA